MVLLDKSVVIIIITTDLSSNLFCRRELRMVLQDRCVVMILSERIGNGVAR